MKRNRNNWIKKSGILCIVLLLISFPSCGLFPHSGENVKYVLTTGFSENEIFRIENQSCSTAEMMLYMTNMQNQYEEVYGSRIWETSMDGKTLEENVKDVVLAKLAQIKCMQLLADTYNISLSEEEEKLIQEAAGQYYDSLTEQERSLMGVSLTDVVKVYSEYRIAGKVYEFIIQDVNPEISDDEARSIKVESILIKTSYLDEDGNRQPYTETEKKQAYELAQYVMQLLDEGYEFEKLVEIYNEDSKSIYSFGMGDMDETFEEAAYNLDTNEISKIVETQYGYHIIKCLSTFDEEETNSNKTKILEKRKNDAFNQVYDQFVVNLTKYMNEESWESLTFLHDETVTTSNMFDIYQSYFE